MNALYRLSKLYAQEQISKSEYRKERANLVNAILKGTTQNDYSTTFAPNDEALDEITQQPTSNNSQSGTSVTPPKKKSSSVKRSVQTTIPTEKKDLNKRNIWLLVILGVIGIALFFVVASFYKHTQPHRSTETDTIQENVDEDPAMQALNTFWERVIVEKQITEQDRRQLRSIWRSAPENVKARFISDLKETIALWEDDFEREIEAGLTLQLLTTVESFPQ